MVQNSRRKVTVIGFEFLNSTWHKCCCCVSHYAVKRGVGIFDFKPTIYRLYKYYKEVK